MVTLTGYANYRRVLSGSNLDYTAALVGAPTASFTTGGQDLARNTGLLGLKINTKINDTWDWFANVATEAARGRSHGVNANVGLEVSF